MDGTLIPVRDRQVGAYSRDHRFSAHVQVIIDANTRPAAGRSQCVTGLRSCDSAASPWVEAVCVTSA
ncbi:hypothetical protein GCM10010274_30270 [Streptomyces lavendofoliae]|uniref:Transposase n=1 Tax=Streptomyces lavendofoliae TaxID=67314 RepID=A0A918HYN0_9ACTN|nr:hypothetical protein GCM10010274_30270 [Streptomyces lavendofoliae]